MLKPKIIQIPDYSEYIGKEFRVTEDTIFEESNLDIEEDDDDSFDRPMLKGVRFIIKKIKNGIITIKVSNTKDELKKLGMLRYDFDRVIKDTKETIEILKTICKLWEDESDKFVAKSKEAHCINTGYYDIPHNHPSKFGMAKAYFHEGKYLLSDSIMTLDYRHTDNKKNIYSYQQGRNEYYSKECYEFMLKGEEATLKAWERGDKKYEKWVLDWILESRDISIKGLNKIKFELYENI